MEKVFYVIFLFCSASMAYGQYEIKGFVSDRNGEPLLGVNVYIKDSYDGCSSDANGRFGFRTTNNGAQTILASFIGYKTYSSEVDLEGDLSLEIMLEEEINKIDGVTISAGAFEASDRKKSVVLRTFDIVTTAGATADVTGVMNTLPGTQTVGEEGRLFVRGGAGHEAKTFINGLLVAEPYGVTPNNIPSRFRFSPFLFKGAFFSTGGYSAEYGQALSSVLQLNTYDLPNRSQTDISIMSVGAGISQTIRKDNTSFYGEVHYTNLTPYFAAVPQKDEWEEAPNSLNSTLHVKRKFGDAGSIQMYTNYDRSGMVMDQLLPGNIHEPARIDIKNQNLYSNVSISNSLGGSASYRGGISFTHMSNHMSLDDLLVETTTNSMHTKLVVDHDLSENFLLKYGLEWINDQYEESSFTPENRMVQNLKYNDQLISTFVETDIYFSNKLVARLGGRYEYNDLINAHEVAPRMSLAYKLDKSSQLSMAFGKFSQLPVREYIKLDAQLKPEKAAHYILNYQYSTPGRVFRSEVYYKKYEQLATKRMTEDNGFQLENTGYGDAKGFELFWRDSKLLKSIDYWISYSYLDTRRKYDIFPSPVMPYYASSHNLSVVYKQFISSIRSQIGWTYSYASGRPYTDPNTGDFNSKMTKDYHDLSLNYSYLLKPNMIIHASISNVPGFDHVFGYQYNASPNEQGVYESVAVKSQAKRFLFLGFFLTISKDKSANQLNNL